MQLSGRSSGKELHPGSRVSLCVVEGIVLAEVGSAGCMMASYRGFSCAKL